VFGTRHRQHKCERLAFRAIRTYGIFLRSEFIDVSDSISELKSYCRGWSERLYLKNGASSISLYGLVVLIKIDTETHRLISSRDQDEAKQFHLEVISYIRGAFSTFS
jgi:hypothetical protein